MALIRLSNIEKSFQDGEDRENNVLRGINMEVEKGEMCIRDSFGVYLENSSFPKSMYQLRTLP